MSLKQKYQSGDPITWLQVHNLLPIIVAIVSIVTAFNLLQGRLDLQSEKTDQVKADQLSCNSRVSSLEQAVRQDGLDIRELQTKDQAVKGIRITPTPVK